MRGSIRRRGKGSWELTIDLGRDPATGKRLRRFHAVRGTRRDAEDELTARLHALATGTDIRTATVTVAQFFERWLSDYAKNSVAPRTFERYSEAVRMHITPALGALKLTELRPLHVVAAERHWLESGRLHGAGGLSPATVLHHHRILRKGLQQALRWQLIAVNPADAVSPPRVPRREMAALDPAQAADLLVAVHGSEFETLLASALYSGLRIGELLGLRWRDLDLAAGHLSVQQTLQRFRDGSVAFQPPKTHRSRRSVSLPSDLVELLVAHRSSQAAARLAAGPAWIASELVFTDTRGRPVSHARLTGAFERLLRDAGLPRIRLHDLRHTMATLMLAAGEHPKVVSERLGHATVSVTLDTYSHVLPGLQAAAAERLAETLRSAARHPADKTS